MRFRLAEPIVTVLAQQIRDNIASACAQVNADVTDGYEILEPQVLDYPLPLELQQQWPLVCLAREGGMFRDDTGFSTGGDWRIGLWVFVSDPDPQGLVRRLERTTAAVLTAALTTRSFTTPLGSAYGITPRTVTPGPMLEGLPRDGGEPPDGFLSYMVATVECLSDEM